jgi:DNA adenine methylase
MIPSHQVYVEAFGGGASVLLRKPPSFVEVYNDIDDNFVNLFRVIRDEEKFKRFYELVYWTPYSRADFEYAKRKLREGVSDDVERAYYFFVVVRQAFSRDKDGGWAYGISSPKRPVDWDNFKKVLLPIHKRLSSVYIEHLDFRLLIPRYDSEKTFFYLDPPYYPGTRAKDIYRAEMTEKDYEDLFNLLLNIKGKVLLSGYYHPAFEVLEKAGWHRKDFLTYTSFPNTRVSENGRPQRIESVWFNYELPNGGDAK